MCEKYNGWSNYETWNAKLWIDNDEYYANVKVPELVEFADGDTYDLARALEEYFVEEFYNDSVVENLPAASDLLGAAVCSINWYEIAENIIADAA